MLTCSKPLNAAPVAPNSGAMGGTPTENYFEYQDLWKHVLNPEIPPDVEFSKDSTADLHSVIYDEFVSAVIKLLQKLVLHYEVSKDTALQDEPAAVGAAAPSTTGATACVGLAVL